MSPGFHTPGANNIPENYTNGMIPNLLRCSRLKLGSSRRGDSPKKSIAIMPSGYIFHPNIGTHPPPILTNAAAVCRAPMHPDESTLGSLTSLDSRDESLLFQTVLQLLQRFLEVLLLCIQLLLMLGQRFVAVPGLLGFP